MNQPNSPIQIVTQLSSIFPDIEGELCSRHSTLFSRIKNTFKQLYDSLLPQRYVIVKGSAEIFNCSLDTSLWMGLENGIIFTVKRTPENSNIFINTNHTDEQIILCMNGKKSQGLHPQIDSIKKCLQLVIEDLPISKLSGGVIYIHSNILQDHFNYHHALMIGIYLSFLIINDNLSNYTINDLIDNLVKSSIKIHRDNIVRSFFFYQNRKLCLSISQNHQIINMETKIKLLICQIDVNLQDKTYEKERQITINQQKAIVLQQMKKKYNINSIEQLISNQTPQQETNGFLQTMIKQINCLSQFSNNKISLDQLIKQKWEIDSKFWKKYNTQFVNFIETMQKQLELKAVCVIQGQFLLIVSDKYRYTDILCKLKKKTSKGSIKSASIGEQDSMQRRWGNAVKIGQKLFSSVPSQGISVFDPTDSIWFRE